MSGAFIPTDVELPPSEPADVRIARLRSTVSTIRAGGGSAMSGTPIERRLFLAACVMAPSGLIFVLLGWYGASRTPYLFEQIPYLVSGGMFGLGLAVVGGFVYFGYWLSLLVSETRTQQSATAKAIESLKDALVAAPPAPAPTVVVPDHAPVALPNGRRERRTQPINARTGAGRRPQADAPAAFQATSKGSMYHRPGCAVVERRGDVRWVTGTEAGLEPCRLCNPVAEPV